MASVYVEQRRLENGVPLSWDIAYHLYTRFQLCDPIFVVVDSPSSMLPSVKKQWVQIIRKLQKERSSTLSPNRNQGLAKAVDDMQALHFRIHTNSDNWLGVTFLTASQLKYINTLCHTMYAIDPSINLERAMRLVKRQGLIVIYKNLP
jgi:hypothetical protein